MKPIYCLNIILIQFIFILLTMEMHALIHVIRAKDSEHLVKHLPSYLFK